MGFPIIDRYMGERLGAELFGLPKVRVTVVESPRRLRPEMSYGFVHALWWVWLNDGRSVISVPPDWPTRPCGFAQCPQRRGHVEPGCRAR